MSRIWSRERSASALNTSVSHRIAGSGMAAPLADGAGFLLARSAVECFLTDTTLRKRVVGKNKTGPAGLPGSGWGGPAFGYPFDPSAAPGRCRRDWGGRFTHPHVPRDTGGDGESFVIFF